VNRYKTDWKVLRYIAERSPKHFATQIRKRNQGLLDALNKRRDRFISSVGCPHCDGDCCSCLWSEAYKHYHSDRLHIIMNACVLVNFGGLHIMNACVLVNFGGYSIPDVRQVVSYWSFQEQVKSIHDSNVREIMKAKAFLKAHIAWTKKPYWGRKVKHT